jgi:hypothetical protein
MLNSVRTNTYLKKKKKRLNGRGRVNEGKYG